jgi:hypothetical protein
MTHLLDLCGEFGFGKRVPVSTKTSEQFEVCPEITIMDLHTTKGEL